MIRSVWVGAEGRQGGGSHRLSPEDPLRRWMEQGRMGTRRQGTASSQQTQASLVAREVSEGG